MASVLPLIEIQNGWERPASPIAACKPSRSRARKDTGAAVAQFLEFEYDPGMLKPMSH